MQSPAEKRGFFGLMKKLKNMICHSEERRIFFDLQTNYVYPIIAFKRFFTAFRITRSNLEIHHTKKIFRL